MKICEDTKRILAKEQKVTAIKKENFNNKKNDKKEEKDPKVKSKK